MATAKIALNLQLSTDLYHAVGEAALARNMPRATYVRTLLEKELKYVKHSERGRRKREPWELEDASPVDA